MPSSDRWEPAKLSIYLSKVGSLSPPSTLDECGLLRKMLKGSRRKTRSLQLAKDIWGPGTCRTGGMCIEKTDRPLETKMFFFFLVKFMM